MLHELFGPLPVHRQSKCLCVFGSLLTSVLVSFWKYFLYLFATIVHHIARPTPSWVCICKLRPSDFMPLLSSVHTPSSRSNNFYALYLLTDHQHDKRQCPLPSSVLTLSATDSRQSLANTIGSGCFNAVPSTLPASELPFVTSSIVVFVPIHYLDLMRSCKHYWFMTSLSLPSILSISLPILWLLGKPLPYNQIH